MDHWGDIEDGGGGRNEMGWFVRGTSDRKQVVNIIQRGECGDENYESMSLLRLGLYLFL